MNSFIIFIFLLFIAITVKAQEEEPDRTNIRPITSGYYVNPNILDQGILLSGEKQKQLFILKDNTSIPELFIDTVADFKEYTVSPDKKSIGFKIIENDKTSIVVFNIEKKKIIKLLTTTKYCSKVSFSNDEKIGFSVGNYFYVLHKKDTSKYKFNEKIIDAVISPKGNFAAIVTEKGVIKILDTKTEETFDITGTNNISPKWSPDASKIVFNNGFELVVWNAENSTIYNLGHGSSPQWAPNSEFLIYQKNTPIKMKFVNADLYISKFDALETYQVTSTINLFEMQAIFVSDNEIVYLTYEDRQVIRAKLLNYKQDSFKVLLKVSK